MGSLMAGWASPVLDEHKVRARRNRSFTREEIEAFRKLHRKNDTEEDQGEGQLSPTLASPKKSQVKDALVLKKSVHLVQNDQLEEVEGGKPDKTGDWINRKSPPQDTTGIPPPTYTNAEEVDEVSFNTQQLQKIISK